MENLPNIVIEHAKAVILIVLIVKNLPHNVQNVLQLVIYWNKKIIHVYYNVQTVIMKIFLLENVYNVPRHVKHVPRILVYHANHNIIYIPMDNVIKLVRINFTIIQPIIYVLLAKFPVIDAILNLVV